MNNRVKYAFIGGALLIFSVLLFGRKRKERMVYMDIQKKIDGVPISTSGGGYGDTTPPPDTSYAITPTQIAEAFYDAGYGKWGTDEQAIFATLDQIAASPNKGYLWQQVNLKYFTTYKRDLVADLKNEMSGTDLDKLNKRLEQFD